MFQQYLKNLEPPFPGMAKKPLPPFLSKLLVSEEDAKISERSVKQFDFMPLFQSFHKEYRIDFDLNIAKFFRALIISNGCEIYDERCFIANMPPMDQKKFQNVEFLQEQIIAHSALNLTLQERLHELETEIIDINKKCLTIKYEIENDPEYTRNLYQAWKLMREKRIEQARIAATPKSKVKDEKGNLIKK